ncbi:hypothetical protein MMC17_009960 [Xylographa soralifera]|nr:hypothetical protein [Xylographa soralifera]
MSLSLEFCEDSDIPRVFAIISDAFGEDHPHISVLFPNHKTITGRAQGAERLLQMKKNDPHARCLKVTDTATSEIIGQATWLIYNDHAEELELSGDYWQNEEDRQYAAELYRGYLAPRRNIIRLAKGPVVCLDILTVDPKRQFGGAGSKLVKWGVEQADQIGAEVDIIDTVLLKMVVEASVFGRHLYEQNGFRVLEHCKVEVSEQWANKPKVRFFFMHRPFKQGLAQNSGKT